MAMPKFEIAAELVEKWGITLNEEVGAYFLKGKRIPDLPRVENDYYIDKTRGTETASKLKMFEKDPFMYFCKYILELDLGDKTDATHFVIGNAVDYFVSYGWDNFCKRYYIPDGIEYIFKPDGESWAEFDLNGVSFKIEELEALIAAAKKTNRGTKTNETALSKERAKFDFIKKHLGKIILNGADYTLIFRIIAEMQRQPLFDLQNDKYKTQVEILAEFNGIRIAGTLDREDVDGDVIRDTKTIKSSDLQHFRRTCNMAVQEFGYDFSTAFYEFLRWAHNSKEGKAVRSDVILDFFGKGPVTKYLCYRIPTEILDESRNRILEVLHRLKKCFDEKDFPLYTEIHGFDDAYLKAPYFQHNPAAIQNKPLDYQPFDLDHEQV